MADEVSGILGFLNFLGLTPDRLVPLIILTLVLYITFHKKIHKHLNPIKNILLEISTIFRNNYGIQLQNCITETRGSPLIPTEYGFKLMLDSGLKNIMKDNEKVLLEELDKKLKENLPITAYDVQEKARELMVGYMHNPLITKVKLYAFKEGINVEAILRPAGLILRDKYFEKHPKIKK